MFLESCFISVTLFDGNENSSTLKVGGNGFRDITILDGGASRAVDFVARILAHHEQVNVPKFVIAVVGQPLEATTTSTIKKQTNKNTGVTPVGSRKGSLQTNQQASSRGGSPGGVLLVGGWGREDAAASNDPHTDGAKVFNNLRSTSTI